MPHSIPNKMLDLFGFQGFFQFESLCQVQIVDLKMFLSSRIRKIYISFRIASREQMAFKVMQFIYSSVLCFDLLQFDPLSSPTISNCIVSVQGFCYCFPFCLMTCPQRNQNKTKLPTESLSVDYSKKLLVEEGPHCPNAQG